MTPRNHPETSRTSRAPVMVRLNPSERATIQRAAAREGIPLSTYMREVAVRDASRPVRRAV
jgi:uncharacterized protein (DUF1778 family)